MRTVVHGQPGSYARGLAARYGAAAAGLGLLAVGAAWTALASRSVFGLVIGAVAGGAANTVWGRARAAWVGYVTERRVLDTLTKMKVPVVWCGLRPGERGGDIDFVVGLHSGRLMVVEAKTGSGKVQVRGDAMFCGRRRLVGNPVGQARSAARKAQRWAREKWGTDLRVITAVCVPDATGGPFQVDGVWVVNLAGLVDIASGRIR